MNVTVEIKAPELVQALNNLAEAISSGSTSQVSLGEQAKPVELETAPVDEPATVYEDPNDLPTYTQEALRATATKLVENGLGKDLPKLFQSVGALKLTEVAEENSNLIMTRMVEILEANGIE